MSIYDNDMFKTGIIKNTSFMNNFQKIIFKKFGVDILFSEFDSGKYQSRLTILVGNKDKELLKTIQSNYRGYPLNDINKKYDKILQEFKSLYEDDNKIIEDEFYLYALSFDYVALTVALNKSKDEIKSYTETLMINCNVDISILPDNRIHFIFQNSDNYNRLKQNGMFERINNFCYKTVRKYDVFHVLKNSAIAIFDDLSHVPKKDRMGLLRG